MARFSPRSATKQEVSLTGGSSPCYEARKRNKRCEDWKYEIKLSIFTEGIIVYIENSKGSVKR
jgi:hypothetical protein